MCEWVDCGICVSAPLIRFQTFTRDLDSACVLSGAMPSYRHFTLKITLNFTSFGI